MCVVHFVHFFVSRALSQNKQSFLVAGDAAYAEAEGESITIVSDSAASAS